MTNQQPPTEENNQQSRGLAKVWQFVKQPRTQIITIISLAGILIGGYFGGKFLLATVVLNRIEEQLEVALEREIDIENTEIDSLYRITFEDVILRPTDEDNSTLRIKELKVTPDIIGLFTRRQLYLDIVASDVKGYAQLDTIIQESDDEKPTPETLLLNPLPITTELNVRLEDTQIAVTPNIESNLLFIDTIGEINFLYDKEVQPITYQLTNRIGTSGVIDIEGETLLSTTQSRNEIKIDALNLPQLTAVIPQLPVSLEQGIVSGKVDINVPAFKEAKNTTLDGYLFVDNVIGRVNPEKVNLGDNASIIPLLQKDILANAAIDFNGQSITLTEAKLNWGYINAEAEGIVDLAKGYNLQANLDSFNLGVIFANTKTQKPPVELGGLLSSNITITGEIDNPLISGNLDVENTLVDKVELGTINSQFSANLDRVEIQRVIVKPKFGGEITSQASIETNLRDTVLAGKPFVPENTQINLKFLANLPPNQVIEAYADSTYGFDFNNFLAVGEVKGTLSNPEGLISFSLPDIDTDNFETVKADGKIVLNQQRIEIKDTKLVADNDRITVDGVTNLNTKKWQINVEGKDFYLTPFISQFCNNNLSCAASAFNSELAINLNSLDSRFQGNLNSIALNDIDGNADVNLQIDDGDLDLEAILVNGQLFIDGNLDNIALNKVVKTIPTNSNVNVVNTNFKASTNVDDLLTATKTNNIPRTLTVRANSNIKVNDGNVNVDAIVNDGNLLVDGNANNIAVNKVIPSIPAGVNVVSTKFNASANVNELLAVNTNPDNIPQSLSLQADTNIKVNDGNVDVDAVVVNGNLVVEGNANNIAVNKIVPAIGTDVNIVQTRFNANAKVNELLTIGKTKNLPPSLSVNAKTQVNVDDGRLNVDAVVANGNVAVNGNGRNISLNKVVPTIPTKVDVVNTDFNVTADVNELLAVNSNTQNLPPSVKLKANTKLNVENTGVVDAVANIDNRQVNVVAKANNIPLNQINPNTDAQITSGEVKINANTQELYQLATQKVYNNNRLLEIKSLDVTANVKGKVAEGSFNTIAKVNNGVFNVNGEAKNISPSKLTTNNQNLPADNLNAKFNASGNVAEVVNLGVNYLDNKTISPLPSLKANADANIVVGEGNAKVNANIANNQWQAKVDSNDINLEYVAKTLAIEDKLPVNLASVPNVSSDINVSGNLDNLSTANKSIPVNIKPTTVALGENVVNLEGKLDVVNVLSQPDIDNLQLKVNANSELATIPVKEILTTTSTPESERGINAIPNQINLDGNAKFTGTITGSNLLTNPLGVNGLNILGDVALTNFEFDNVKFEPLLAGKVKVNPQSEISIDLRGNQDVIAARVVKDDLYITPLDTTIAYTPQNIEIRQGGENGLRVLGNRQGNEFIASVDNLSLDGLQLQPVTNYGIDGKLKGNLSTDIALNLNDFSARGNINLIQPGVDFINAQEISGSFAYKDNLARVDDGVVKFGESEYNLTGEYNLQTQDIFAKVDLEGDVQDIFNTLKITDVASLTALAQQLQTGDSFADADEIAAVSIAEDKKTIESQVNLLYSIDQQIKTIAKEIKAGNLPNNLYIQGDYQGELVVGGNLKNPVVDLDLSGKRWQWLPQSDFPNIVDSLGFVMEQSESIAIPEIDLNAQYRNNTLTLQPFSINVAGSEISVAGEISSQSQNAEFKVTNFPLDLATRFFPLPVDVDTNIDLEGTVKGRFINPEINGVLTLNNTAFNGSLIEDEIVTNFGYENYVLDLKTIAPEYLTLNAKLPYHPIYEINEPAFINLQTDEKSSSLIGLLTQGQVNISGGEYTSNLDVEINSINELIKNFDIADVNVKGDINFEQTEITTVFLEEKILVSGDVNLSPNRVINVENLNALVNQTNINIEGSLPILSPTPQNNNLLAVSIPQQPLNLEGLYSGDLDADIKIDGTVLSPRIGGYLALINGNFQIPSRDNPSNNQNEALAQQWLGKVNENNAPSILNPRLNDFNLKLQNSQLAQWGLYRFLFEGDINVNGPALDLNQLSASGLVNLRRGQIYLSGASPVSAISGLGSSQTTFNLSRTNENQIVFDPDESILNPQVDVELNADVVDYARELPTSQRNEINDPIIRGGRGETVQVTLNVDGGLAQLLPVLSGEATQSCNFGVPQTIPGNVNFSTAELDSIAKCVNFAILNPSLSTSNILNSPLVSLSSTPNRSEGELVNLIVGGQLLNLATQLQNSSGEDLLENGLIQFVLVPIANSLSFGVNERVSTWGKPLGMKDLRVFPLVEGIYEVQENGNVSVSYDYIYDEFKVRYQLRF